MNTVLEFIRENYKSDISREGLAAAIDMNPNYMSSQFKTYTGKRITSFINELRIDEAKQRLREENQMVFDIALSVGYESFSTFNRAFKKITGTTPTEYRNKNLTK